MASPATPVFWDNKHGEFCIGRVVVTEENDELGDVFEFRPARVVWDDEGCCWPVENIDA